MVGLFLLSSDSTFPDTELSSTVYNVVPFSVVPWRIRYMNNLLAVVPRTPDLQPVVDRFVSDMTALHPPLNLSALPFPASASADLRALYIPGFADVVTKFASEADLESYIKSATYDRDWEQRGQPKIWAAIVFNSDGPAVDYKIRMNTSMVPQPRQPPVNVLARGYSDSDIKKYLFASMPTTGPPFLVEKGTEITRLPYPGFMSLQLMVDRWVLNRSIPLSQVDVRQAMRIADQVLGFCIAPQPGPQMFGPLAAALLPLAANSSAAVTITQTIMAWLGELAFMPQQVQLTPFPYFGYKSNPFYGTALGVLSFFLVIAYVFPVSRLIRGLVLEKEVKMREGMKMMGLGDAALFGSWFAFYAIFYAILSLLIALMSMTTLFRNSQNSTIWFIFFVFGVSCTTFSYLISVFFTQSKTASSVGIVIFIASYFPCFSVSDGSIDPGIKLAASLLSPTAFGLTINAVGLLEQNGAGVQPNTSAAIINNFSVSNGIGMMVLDSILYVVLAWYVDAVLPVSLREYGVPRPWYFPFTAAYWREVFDFPALPAGMTTTLSPAAPQRISAPGPDASYIEAPDANLISKEREGRFVSVSKLRKEFNTPDGTKVAVNDIDMTMYE